MYSSAQKSKKPCKLGRICLQGVFSGFFSSFSLEKRLFATNSNNFFEITISQSIKCVKTFNDDFSPNICRFAWKLFPAVYFRIYFPKNTQYFVFKVHCYVLLVSQVEIKL